MKVRDVMTRGCECVAPDTTLEEAARRMRDLDVGPLPVCDNGRLAGIVTDRDIVIRGIAEGRSPRDARVRDVMTPRILYCYEDQKMDEVAQMMKQHQVRRLVVLDRHKNLVGIVSIGDLAVETQDEVLVGSALEAISEPKV